MLLFKNVVGFNLLLSSFHVRTWRTFTKIQKMNNSSILIQKFNPITGQLEWEMRNEDYDYTQEVARAGFADMLHDEERVN